MNPEELNELCHAAYIEENAEAQLQLGNYYYDKHLYEYNEALSRHEAYRWSPNQYLTLWVLSSNAGNQEASQQLTAYVQHKPYEKKNIDKIQKSIQNIPLWRQNAKNGDAKAAYELSNCFCAGSGVPKDEQLALRYLLLSADKGYDVAQSEVGEYYYRGTLDSLAKENQENINFDLAKYYWELAAKQGNSSAMYGLGLLYLSVDIDKAIYYLNSAVEKGEYRACEKLIAQYVVGKSVKRDVAKIEHYVQILLKIQEYSAESFLYNIGCYLYSNGKEINDLASIEEGYKILLEAVKLDSDDARIALALVYLEGICIPTNTELALQLLHKAAEYEYHYEALMILGQIYNEGKYVERDHRKSIEYYSIAAQRGSSKAKYIVGVHYLFEISGRIKPNSEELGIRYLKEAADDGIEAAQEALDEYNESPYQKVKSSVNNLFDKLRERKNKC